MNFYYKKIGAGFLRPVIPVEIIHGSEAIRYEVLVDSGADCNIVPAEIGELLGIDIERGKKDIVGGITGGGFPYFIHTVAIRIGGYAYTVPMGFMPDMPSMGYGVVGQRGFFEFFKVTFDLQKAEIDIRLNE